MKSKNKAVNFWALIGLALLVVGTIVEGHAMQEIGIFGGIICMVVALILRVKTKRANQKQDEEEMKKW